jgi:hypothetical protein
MQPVTVQYMDIFLVVHFFTLLVILVNIAQQPGQAGMLGRLSLCLWLAFLFVLRFYCKYCPVMYILYKYIYHILF